MTLDWRNDTELLARLEDEADFERVRREARRIVDAEERSPVEWPEVLTLRDRLALPVDPLRYRIDGWLPIGGRAILAAPAKAGKTNLALNVVRSVVDGAAFLGTVTVTPVTGHVLVLDFEMTPAQLAEWYRTVGIVSDDRVTVLPMRGRGAAFDLRDEKVRTRWSAFLLELGVDFIVWDCLRPVLDALGLDENHDASALLTAFDTMRTAGGEPEALVVHHMGHGAERARGDSAIIGWSDVNMKLVLGEDGSEFGPRWLSAQGRDVLQGERQLAFDPHTRRFSDAGVGSRAVAKMTRASAAVEAILLDAEEPLTKTAIEVACMASSIPREQARKALEGLVALNQVLVEPGEKRALLHRWNPAIPPNRLSPPLAASGQPVSTPPPYRAANWRTEEATDEASGEQRTANTLPFPTPVGELDPAAAALLAQLNQKEAK